MRAPKALLHKASNPLAEHARNATKIRREYRLIHLCNRSLTRVCIKLLGLLVRGEP